MPNDVSTPYSAAESGFKPTRTRGDRGNAFKRAKLIAGRSPKEMGIRRTFKKVPWYWAMCDHKDKRGRLNCKQKFGGLTVALVMGNKALHEYAHDQEDRRIAEMAGVTN